MGNNLEIDNRLMRQALKGSGLPSKEAAIEEGLRLVVNVHGHRSIRRFRGKIVFDAVLNKKGMT
ncbi:MAG: type II toxin-antitoxin system VapB family antitoxin [Nitrospira sp.]|nr:type II toxin-antitoxin system VapB family antitoxin [Nitrospira sp.]